MPEYHFTGAYPRVLAGLSQGVNALLLPADRPTPPYGSTIEAQPGDSVQTDEPYDHPELESAYAVGGLLPPSDPPSDVIPALLDQGYVIPAAPAPVDPAHDAMTAEGAPAPAAPTA